MYHWFRVALLDSNTLGWLMTGWLIKGFVLLLLASAVACAFRKDSAAMRHLVWLVAIIVLLITPVLTAVLPQWRLSELASVNNILDGHSGDLGLPPESTQLVNAEIFVTPTAETSEVEEFPSQAFPRYSQASGEQEQNLFVNNIPTGDENALPNSPSESSSYSPLPQSDSRAVEGRVWLASWIPIVFWIWFAGFALLSARLLIAWMYLRVYGARSQEIARWRGAANSVGYANLELTKKSGREASETIRYEKLVAAFNASAQKLRLSQTVRLMLQPGDTIPIAWGITNPRVELPANATNWGPEKLEAVIVHELAHIQRQDVLTQTLTQIVCAFNWLNPLVWYAAYRMHVERESACDDLVVKQGIPASQYAEQLLKVASEGQAVRWAHVCGLAMARSSSLAKRLEAILSVEKERRHVTRPASSLAIVIGLVFLVPMAMVQAFEVPRSELPSEPLPFQPIPVQTDEESSAPTATDRPSNPTVVSDDEAGDEEVKQTSADAMVEREFLSQELIRKLKWGDNVQGLRAAVMVRRTKSDVLAMYLVIQNVSSEKITLDDTQDSYEHTLYLKDTGEILGAFSSNEPKVEVTVLAPNEALILAMFSLEPRKDKKASVNQVMTETLILDADHTVYATFETGESKPGAWKGKLRTAEVGGEDATVSAPPRRGVPLSGSDSKRWNWGPVQSGLRAALAIRDSAEATSVENPQLFLAVQNVSSRLIRLVDTKSSERKRLVSIYDGEILQSRTRADEPTMVDVYLQPQQVFLFPILPSESEPSKGNHLARAMLKRPTMFLSAEFNIEVSPPGAWQGKLVVGKTNGERAQSAPLPRLEPAKKLYETWLENARVGGLIPGGMVASLKTVASRFVENNPTHEGAPGLLKLLERMDTRRDWSLSEAVKLLDEVSDEYANLPQWVLDQGRFSLSPTIRTGKPLPSELESAPWGSASPEGLRVAWLLDPRADEYHLNTPLRSRLLYHNAGNDSVIFRLVSWNQGGHKARSGAGEALETKSTHWTTIGQIQACQLAPGEYVEVIGAGIGVGPNLDQEDWRNTRVGTWIHAKAGDEVTFIPSSMTVAGKDGRMSEIPDDVWWSTFVKTELSRYSPIPPVTEEEERSRILRLAVRRLFATTPLPSETAAFMSDDSPQPLENLAKRLAARPGTQVLASGDLQSANTTFRVLPVDPEAKLRPRLAIGPGRYEFSEGKRLVIVGRATGMDAKLEVDSTTYEITLPKQRSSWAIAWKRGKDFFWLADRGVLRLVEFADPTNIVEKRITNLSSPDIPARYLKALKPTLDAWHRLPASTR